ncbi:MAG: ribonuclease HII [Nanoarchaeota archaeon]
MKLVAGIDEAGRGPLLGPMGLAIVACEEPVRQSLAKAGVKDSKQLSVKKRTDHARLIRRSCFHAFKRISPTTIDTAVNDPCSSLTALEAIESANLIIRLSKKIGSDHTLTRIIIDLPSKNKDSYLALIRKHLPEHLRSIPLIAEYKADQNHIEVSAASIIAKNARDSAIRSFEKKHDIRLGSGYPSDPLTRTSLIKNYDLLVSEGFARESWAPVRKLKTARVQSSLDAFQ